MILNGKLDGVIYGPEYKDAKETLSRQFDEAYSDLRGPYMHSKGYTPDSEWEDKLGSYYGLHSAISVSKRLAKLPPAPSPQLDHEVREFFAATQPIAVMIADLKSKVVKGRKPNPDVIAKKAAVAASRLGRDGECQICQRRHILDSRGNLVLHGYQRPGHGYIVGDCFGVGHPPWEVSSDALAEWIELLKKQSAEATQDAARVAKLTTITINRGSELNPKMVTLTKGDPSSYDSRGSFSFESVIEKRVRDLKQQARWLSDDAKREAQRLKTWKPKPLRVPVAG
ncbi:MAG TPA: hypothetical protein VLE97_10775 [Gaiellaceae bacterium]|nr:hypothetical protein [Gaiellaceae bacterium]